MPDRRSFPGPFSPADRLMWKIERDPVLRSPILTFGLLDREPDWPLVRATMTRAVRRVPRLRQKVVVTGRSGLGGSRGLRWEDDDAFSLDYHLRRVRAPEPRDVRAALDLVSPWATAMFDPARPLWELTVIEGLEGGRAAFLLKFHHTITDGVGGVDLASLVFDGDRHGAPIEPIVVEVADDEEAVAPADGWSQLAHRATTMARAGAGLVRAGAGVVRDPVGAASGAVRFAGSLGRMLQPVPEPMSPVLRSRGLDRRLDLLELPLDGLRRAASAVDGTINDVYLAAVGGGLHDYHERLGHEVAALRVTMPISLRRPEDPPGGNRFTPARFVLPIDDPDPARRAKIAGAIVRRWRDEPAVGLTDVLALVLDQLPDDTVTQVFGSMLRNVDVDAVDVPGLASEAFLGGARIDRMWAFAPPTGAALSITLLSHLDTACVGLLSDVAAVRDPELLHTCIASAFEEAMALAPAVDERTGVAP